MKHVVDAYALMQIVATTLLLAASGEPATLLTHDDNITASGLVPVVW
jgi:hypothetical protein